MTPPSSPAPSGSWPDGAAATAYLARIESLLKARGLKGTERRFKPLMRQIVAAFQARDMAGVTAGCDALVDAIEEQPAEGGKN
jgi:hypothetical protein